MGRITIEDIEVDKVSIIIPIYNVEKYLEKCVQSVLSQSYENIEVILVDDGSTDCSGQICDRLEKEDNRIRVIHKKNGGLASARNAGYQAASGEYIMYADSDDSLKSHIIETCVKSIYREKADVVIFGYNKVSENGKILETCKWDTKTYTHDEMTEHLYDSICEMSFGYAWNKLYRKSVLDMSGVSGDAKVIDREDLIYNLELLKHWKKITYIDSVGYDYLQRSSSLLHNSNLARLNGITYFVDKINQIHFDDSYVERKIYNMIVLHYLSDCIIKNVIWNKKLNKKEKTEQMKKTLEVCPKKEKLYLDKGNGRYLQMLYKSIKTGKMNYFYWYVKLGDFRRKLLKRIEKE